MPERKAPHAVDREELTEFAKQNGLIDSEITKITHVEVDLNNPSPEALELLMKSDEVRAALSESLDS